MVRRVMSKKELEKIKREIVEEKKRFISMYVEWLKKTKPKEWSKQQKMIVDSQMGKKE